MTLTLEEITAVLLGQLLDQVSQAPLHEREDLLYTITVALGHTLGYFEGQLVLLGHSREDRTELLKQAVRAGKDHLLQDHDVSCRSCAAGDILRSEVYPN